MQVLPIFVHYGVLTRLGGVRKINCYLSVADSMLVKWWSSKCPQKPKKGALLTARANGWECTASAIHTTSAVIQWGTSGTSRYGSTNNAPWSQPKMPRQYCKKQLSPTITSNVREAVRYVQVVASRVKDICTYGLRPYGSMSISELSPAEKPQRPTIYINHNFLRPSSAQSQSFLSREGPFGLTSSWQKAASAKMPLLEIP